ncbi:MAG: HDIG domain-containing protein [Roseiflexaceae bacterium]|nr:HDIG domain-containing protein [Roseiflexaceae bacterium]
MSYTEQAEQILREWVQGEQLRKHCYAVAASMRHLAAIQGGDPDLWAAVAILHDMDYERFPGMPEKDPAIALISQGLLDGSTDVPQQHPFVGVAYLRDHGWSQEVLRAILAHADYSGIAPETAMEKTLVAVDELSSFVIAVALVKPTKSVFDVNVSSVRKKMKDKAFARAVNREEILHGAQGLGMEIDTLIGLVIEALRADAARLGVAGIAV